MNPPARTLQVKTLGTALAALVIAVSSTGAAGFRVQTGGLDGLDPSAPTEQARVGLALSGGGARGVCTVGIIKAFEERGIVVDAVTGTSIGGVIGGLYACGYSTEELTDIVRGMDIGELVATRPPRTSMFLTHRQEREKYLLSVRFDGWRPEVPSAWTGAQEITTLLTRLTLKQNYLAGRDFSRFPIPFKTVGTNVASGEQVIFDHGSLVDAMRATMAFPLALTGVESGDSILMDGGMLVPVPVALVKEMVDPGAVIVAVNTTSPLLSAEEIRTPVDVANQVTSIMTADKLKAQLALADLVIAPVGSQLASTDFEYADSLIALGYAAGLAVADSIIALGARRSDPTTYNVCRVDISCPDSTLASRFSLAHLTGIFTRRQLIETLKALVSTEPVFQLAAELIPEIRDNDSTLEAGLCDVVLLLNIQPQLKVADVSLQIDGNTHFDDLTLAQQCGFPDSLLSPDDLRHALDKMIALYRSEGYDMADVRQVDVNFDEKRIYIVIDEAIIGRIDVAETQRSRDWLVRSYFPLNRGEPFSLAGATRGLSDLYGTELFERLSVDLKSDDTAATMIIRARERKYSQVRLGWHWHDEYQSEQFIEYLDDNVNGIGLEFLTHLQYGPDRQVFHTGLRLNRIFFTYLTARLQFYRELLDRNLFNLDGEVQGYRDEDRWGGAFYLGQQIARLGQVQVGLRAEQIETIDHFEATSALLNLRTLHFESEIESFDRYPFPSRGKKHRFDIRFAGKFLGGEVEYNRFFTSVEAYYPLGEYLNYHVTASLGLSRRGLPPSEKFHAGGLNSFAGFRTSELSGEKLILLNQELRVNLPYRLYLTGRFDLGDLYTSADDIKPEEFRTGFGVALALDLPIGPFEFGYGGGDSPKDRVYFSAGFRF
jgi:NTE family protein